jgi:hypothetical protein
MAVNSVVDDRIVDGCIPADLARGVDDQRIGLAARLEAISRSRSQQEAIAERSYWHPNGFIKLVLDENPSDGELRLHIWPTPSVDDDIHSHAWYYQSIVLAGELREDTYRESASDEGQVVWQHSYPRVGHRRFMLTDPVRVRLVQAAPQVLLRANHRHGGHPNHIHRFYALATPAVTMLRVGPVVDGWSHVYRSTAVRSAAVVPQPTSRRDIAEWIDKTIQLMVTPP